MSKRDSLAVPQIRFPQDRAILPATSMTTLLDAAIAANLQLAHACGGFGKCSTCRVLVLEGEENLTARTPDESLIATRLRFPDDVRLACQARATGDVSLRRLVVDAQDAVLAEGELVQPGPRSLGEERRVAILFCDVRNFTAFSEAHFPYDVVHLLNRWFSRAEEVVKASSGRIDNFMGDGLMAVFGESRPETGALDAVKAGLGLLAAAGEMSRYVESAFGAGFRIGVGIHWGDVVLGAVGAGERRRMTAIGDAVNLAARIEAATKDAGTDLLLSRAAYEAVKERVVTGKRIELALKGKTGMHALVEVTAIRT